MLGQSIASMRIPMGQHMTQSANSCRRAFGRARLLLAASALLIVPASADAQVFGNAFGYAPPQQNFPSDYVISDEGKAAPQ